jgi:hypothetical protein
MVEDEFVYEAHERLRCRTANKMDSVLWTYKAHYEAADWYSTWSSRMDWGTTFGAAAITIGLLWEAVPHLALVGLAIVTAVLAGYKTASKPQNKAEDHYDAGDAYHKLFEEFRDFVEFELADEETGLDNMKSRFDTLSKRRTTLNDEMPNLPSKWYNRLDDSIYDQIETTDNARERLTGEAELSDVGDDQLNLQMGKREDSTDSGGNSSG